VGGRALCQKPAGSPLNCFTLCLLRHLAMRGVAPGERRGAGKKTMLGSYGRTICPVPGGHRVSVSWEGGSLATKADAEAADAYWQELRDSLGEPLNLGKWQQCRQSDHDMVCELGGSYVDGAAATGAGAATSTAPRPPVPSSADAVFLQEEMSAFFSLTRDASPHGWAAVVRWWGEVDGHGSSGCGIVAGWGGCHGAAESGVPGGAACAGGGGSCWM